MIASTLLRHGPEYLRTLVADLETWLNRRGFASVSAIKGLMKHQGLGVEAQERGDYIRGLLGYRSQRVSSDK
jgi:dihydroorotate dehydrogenase (fumarate)